MVSKVPGFFYSTYQQTASFASVLMREDQYYTVMQRIRTAVNISMPANGLVPKQRLLIRVTDGATKDERDDVVNGLRTFFPERQHDLLRYARPDRQCAKVLQSAFRLLQYCGRPGHVMCFFILFLSFTANVHEHAWEFGVLRALAWMASRR